MKRSKSRIHLVGGEMKMGIFCSGIVWGALLILFGISLILKYTLNIDIPVIRIFFALFLIYLGVKVILGGFRKEPTGPNVFFSQRKVDFANKDGEYNVVFGKGVIDLTGIPFKDKDMTIVANTVFGSSTVKIKRNVPTLVRANAAFGNAKLPDGNTAAVGTYLYKNKAYQEGKPCLTLNINVVFGEFDLVEE